MNKTGSPIPSAVPVVVCVLAIFAPAADAWAKGDKAAAKVKISVVGTTDLHGRVERTAALAGYLDVIRAEPNTAVVLVDGGDMFQGTLESNLEEGASVVRAYNQLRYDAVTVGNHEFDFGPAGPLATPRSPTDDAQGALKRRGKEAKFPFLAANTVDDKTGLPVAWPNFKPSTIVKKKVGNATVRIGIIGVTTIDTKKTTSAQNTSGLTISPLRDAVLKEADALRKQDVDLVVLAAHAGGKCHDVDKPHDVSSCDADSEIFELARALPQGLVDVIVAGHTHNQMAHVVNGIAIVIGWANGKGFSRVDFEVDRKTHRAALANVHQPTTVCSSDDVTINNCAPKPYHGHDVVVAASVLKQLAPAVARAKQLREQRLGVVLSAEITRGYDKESPLGNLFSDLVKAGAVDVFHERIDVGLMNGGGIRADLPKGELTYGALFEMMPFDNRYALLKLTADEFSAILAQNYSARKSGLLNIGGITAKVSCQGPKASVTLVKDGQPVPGDAILHIATTDFLATGGDGSLDKAKARHGVLLDEDGEPIREHLARVLRSRGGTINPTDTSIFDRSHPRIDNAHSASARCQP